MVTNSPADYFNVCFAGQIESVAFPLGPDASEIFCRFEIVTGPDWDLISGHQIGITQSALKVYGGINEEIVFNMPIELTYKSTSPFGWPQMIVSIYGRNKWGLENTLGYSRLHMPICESQTIIAPIIIPKSPSMISEAVNWITNKNAELKNPKILVDGTKNKELSMESYGEVKLNLSVISRGSGKLGYC